MRLHVLGSSGGYSVPDNPCTGFLLEHGEARLWIDAGTGTLAAVQRILPLERIDALVVSHVHADHCADLFTAYVAFRFQLDGKPLRKPLWAPREVWEVVPRFLDPSGAGVLKLEEAFEFHPLEDGAEAEIAGIRFRCERTDHPVETLALRAEADGAVLAFSADTGPAADLTGLARDADLFVCEACYQNAAMGGPVHLSARQAAGLARRAGVRKLALTHIWPTLDPEVSLDEAREAAGEVPVELARPGGVFEI
ncbi:MAG TPA: MBL fold metallo-hydrolase [Thermoanaerobaculia bacterium]|nr:MBL fold metallo-hydrolase [Thermoanaerobaculia bacterium]